MYNKHCTTFFFYIRGLISSMYSFSSSPSHPHQLSIHSQPYLFLAMSTSAFKCSFCSEAFASKGIRDSHSRDKCPVKVYQLSIANNITVNIQLNQDGYFHCLCNDGTCNKTFTSCRQLARHIKNVTNWGFQVCT